MVDHDFPHNNCHFETPTSFSDAHLLNFRVTQCLKCHRSVSPRLRAKWRPRSAWQVLTSWCRWVMRWPRMSPSPPIPTSVALARQDMAGYHGWMPKSGLRMLQGVPAPVHMVIDLTLCRGYIRHKPQPTSRIYPTLANYSRGACHIRNNWFGIKRLGPFFYYSARGVCLYQELYGIISVNIPQNN